MDVIKVLENWLETGKADKEAARSAAWSAESAESAAWSAESAESAARSAEYEWMSDELIRLIEETK